MEKDSKLWISLATMITLVHKMIKLLSYYFDDEIPDARIDRYILACRRQRLYQRERHMPVGKGKRRLVEAGNLSQKRHPLNEQKTKTSSRPDS